MNCEKYRDALTEAALAAQADAAPRAPRDAALRAHLEACAACRAELERLRALAAAIDTGLAQIAAADPSPAFAARIRARLAEEADRRASRWHTWAPTLAGALTAVVLLAWFATRFDSEPQAPPETAFMESPAPIRPNAEPPRLAPATAHKSNDTARDTPPRMPPLRSAPASNGPALPPVLVSGDEWRQVATLYALVQSGRADAEMLAPPDLAPLREKFQPLVIAPMDPIKPLTAQPLDAQSE